MKREPYPTATACSSVRGTQMRHSTSPRNRSATRKLKRPTWSSERRLERATSRSGSSVSSARFAMCSILGSHGQETQGKSRGTGGEDGVYAQALGLVGPRRARPAVAPHARSLSRARLRVHAAADASESRGGVLSALYRALPRPRDDRERQAPGCERGLGWAGLLRPGFESPCVGERRYT